MSFLSISLAVLCSGPSHILGFNFSFTASGAVYQLHCATQWRSAQMWWKDATGWVHGPWQTGMAPSLEKDFHGTGLRFYSNIFGSFGKGTSQGVSKSQKQNAIGWFLTCLCNSLSHHIILRLRNLILILGI